jgi:hypothetical protein
MPDASNVRYQDRWSMRIADEVDGSRPGLLVA